MFLIKNERNKIKSTSGYSNLLIEYVSMTRVMYGLEIRFVSVELKKNTKTTMMIMINFEVNQLSSFNSSQLSSTYI